MAITTVDAIVIGAGLSGIYQLHSLLKLGLSVKLIEQGADVGGTWFWNRYPGAMSDTPSQFYRYSWDKEDLRTYPWAETYLDAPEILVYLRHIVDKYDLRKFMQFNTKVLSATWFEEGSWSVQTSQSSFRSRYLITALGLLSEPNWPNIPNRHVFKGQLVHTSRWPSDLDLSDKKVGIIGNGSTGVQVITRIAKDVGTLTCFQRHPQYTVPCRRVRVTNDQRDDINNNYDALWHQANNSASGMGIVESKISTFSVSDEERERIYQEAWDQGSGMRMLFTTFSDLTYNEAANRTVCNFIKRKIAQIVKDPIKRQKLMPTELYNRRPLSDTGYYEQFNRPNVGIVDIASKPITAFTPEGLALADGTKHDLDILICATGFNAFDGAYTRIAITGRNGTTLKSRWAKGPITNMGVAVSGFPNLFMVLGPKSPLANVPPMVEAHVNFITQAIARAEEHRRAGRVDSLIESTSEGEDAWQELCDPLNEKLLFKKSDSYLFGANVEGKPKRAMIFFGGLQMFRERLEDCTKRDFVGFHDF